MEWLALYRWLHLLSGITWIGLLYYFNLVHVPALAEAAADKEESGPTAITKYIMPRALQWFRWAAVVTWLSGAAYLGRDFMSAFTLGIGTNNPALTVIGMGAWLGTIMVLNVWFLIWPNQKKVLGLVHATDEEKAKARRVAFLASRITMMLSIPMLLFMGAASHGLPF